MSAPDLFSVLRICLNPASAPADRKRVEQQLLVWEAQPGFVPSLLQIVTQNSERSLQMLALLEITNTVRRQWVKRRKSQGGMSDEDKNVLKSTLFKFFEIEDNVLAKNVATIISLIASHDYPTRWPSLLTDLQRCIQAPSGKNTRRRALLSLYYTVKVMKQSRSPMSRRRLQEVGATIFEFVVGLWKQSVEALLGIQADFAKGKAVDWNSAQLTETVEVGKITSQILLSIVTYALRDYANNPTVNTFLNMLVARFQDCVTCRNQVPMNPYTPAIENLIKNFGKLMTGAYKTQPQSWIQQVPTYMQFCFNHVHNFEANAHMPLFQIHCMQFIKSIIDPACVRDGTPTAGVVGQFFDGAKIKQLVEDLILKYFAFTQTDLEQWKDEPLQFVLEAETAPDTMNRRACAENLYLYVIQKFKLVVAPYVMSILQNNGLKLATTMQETLQKDAIYMAIGDSCYELEQFQFIRWYTTNLTNELKQQMPGHVIIKRRIAWLMGKWVSSRTVPNENRGMLYTDILGLLRDNDNVVAFTAVLALRNVIAGESDFAPEYLVPYLGDILGALFNLFTKANSEPDMLPKLLDCIKEIIEATSDKIRPFTEQIISLASKLWDTADVPHLKLYIIRTLSSLAKMLGDCKNYFQYFAPVVQYATSIQQPDSLYLLEEGLQFWKIIMDNVTALTEHMVKVYPNVTAIMARNTDRTLDCMPIIEKYILLGQQSTFVQQFIGDIAASIAAPIGRIAGRHINTVLRPAFILLLAYPQAAPSALSPVLQKALMQTLNPTPGSGYDLEVTEYLTLFANVCLRSPQDFLNFFTAMTTHPANTTKQNLLLPFLKCWTVKMDDIPKFMNKRLNAMGVLSLIKMDVLLSNPVAVKCLADAFGTIGGVLADEVQSDTLSKKSYFPVEDIDFNDINKVTAQVRYHFLVHKDPLLKATLREVMSSTLNSVQATNPKGFEILKQHINPIILGEIQKYLSGEV